MSKFANLLWKTFARRTPPPVGKRKWPGWRRTAFVVAAAGGGLLGAQESFESDRPARDRLDFAFDARTLQHPHLIKQATSDVVVSASQTLTVVAAAFQDVSARIRELVTQEMLLLRPYTDLGELAMPDEHYDVAVELRGAVNELKKDLETLKSYMEYAERLATVAAEISHFSGNTIASDVIMQQITQINRFYETEIKLNEELEMEYVALKSKAIASSRTDEDLEGESET